jgi:hypothetical protein
VNRGWSAAAATTAAAVVVSVAAAASGATAGPEPGGRSPAGIVAPTATLSADHQRIAVNLDRRYRRDTVTVKVKLPRGFVSLGRVTLNRKGDRWLDVPARRVRSMESGLRVRFVMDREVIGRTRLRTAASGTSSPSPTPEPTLTPPTPYPTTTVTLKPGGSPTPTLEG